MKTFFIEDENFNMKELLEKLNTLDCAAEIYIDSYWGVCQNFEILLSKIEYINKNKYPITLIWMFLWSKAFDMFYNYTWPRQLAFECNAIIHTTALKLNVFSYKWELRIRINEYEIWNIGDIPECDVYEFLEWEDLQRYIEWRDVAINSEKLIEIINKQDYDRKAKSENINKEDTVSDISC